MNVDVAGFASNSFAYVQLLNAESFPAKHLSIVNPLAKSPGYLPMNVLPAEICAASTPANASSFLIVAAVIALPPAVATGPCAFFAADVTSLTT